MSADTDKPPQDDDPRSLSDHRIRQKHSREEVQRWRDQAAEHHRRWFDVMNNPYGQD